MCVFNFDAYVLDSGKARVDGEIGRRVVPKE